MSPGEPPYAGARPLLLSPPLLLLAFSPPLLLVFSPPLLLAFSPLLLAFSPPLLVFSPPLLLVFSPPSVKGAPYAGCMPPEETSPLEDDALPLEPEPGSVSLLQPIKPTNAAPATSWLRERRAAFGGAASVGVALAVPQNGHGVDFT